MRKAMVAEVYDRQTLCSSGKSELASAATGGHGLLAAQRGGEAD